MIFGRAMILLCFVGFLTAILDILWKGIFLPSAEWAGGMGWPVFLGSFVPSALALLLLFRHDAATRPPTRKGASGQMALYVIGGAVFMAMGLTLVVFHTVPVAHALAVRDNVTHVHVVARDYPSGTRHCRRALRLDGLPLLQDAVCRVPRDFFHQLDVGDRVAVSGLGSSLGVFPERLRALGP